MPMRSKFWRIDAPEYEDGYNRHLFINGVGSHPFALPGYSCELCGGKAGQRILPIECPIKFRKERMLRDRWPIPFEKYQSLSSRLQAELRKEGFSENLRPGDSFQPAILEFAS